MSCIWKVGVTGNKMSFAEDTDSIQVSDLPLKGFIGNLRWRDRTKVFAQLLHYRGSCFR